MVDERLQGETNPSGLSMFGASARSKIIVCVFLFLFGFALAHLTATSNVIPTNNELYHLFAGESLMEGKGPQIYQGSYARSVLYSWVVGPAAVIGGDPYKNATAINTLIMSVFVCVFYLCLCKVADSRVALLAAIIFLLSSHTMEYATTVRFYTLHACLFWIAAYSFFNSFPLRIHASWLWLAAGLALILVCWHLQPITLIGLMGIGVWWYICFFMALSRTVSGKHLFLLIAATVLVALAVLAIAPLEKLWVMYRHTALWYKGSSVLSYYRLLSEDYAPMLAIVPLCLWISISKNKPFAIYAVTVFSIAIIVHSFGGMKNDRYIYYTLPFFFALTAQGLVLMGDYLREASKDWMEKTGFTSTGWVFASSKVLLVLCLSFFILMNQGVIRTLRAVESGSIRKIDPARWDLLKQTMPQLVPDADVVLVNDPLNILYFFQRPAIGVSRSRLSDSGNLGEFSTDLRHGLTSVSNLESVQELVRCVPNGLILSDKRQWGGKKYTGFDDQIATYTESHLEKVPVPDAWKMVVYRWDNSTTTSQTGPSCEHAAAYM